MSIAALITQGIGPGGSVLYALTGGLDIGVAVDTGPSGHLIRRTRRRWKPWLKELEKQAKPAADRPSIDELRLELETVQDEIRLALSAYERDEAQIATMERAIDLLNRVIEQAEEDELETLILLV
jgi:hypothetical protein